MLKDTSNSINLVVVFITKISCVNVFLMLLCFSILEEKMLNLGQIAGVLVMFFALFVSLFLLLQKTRPSNKILSVYFLLFFFIQLFSFFYDAGFRLEAIWAIALFVGARLLLPVVMYLYVFGLVNGIPITSIYLHRGLRLPLLVFLFILLVIAALFGLPLSKSVSTLILKGLLYFVLVVHFLLFATLTIYYLLKLRKLYLNTYARIGNVYSYEEGITIKWIRFYGIGFIVYCLFTYAVDLFDKDIPEGLYNLFILLYLFFIGIKSMQQNELYLLAEQGKNNFRMQAPEWMIKVLPKDLDALPAEGTKAELQVEVTEEQVQPREQEWVAKMQGLMNSDHWFLNSELSINDFALALNVNSKYLSSAINKVLKVNFVSFVNQFRVEYAIKLFAQPGSAKLTIEAIGKQCGFKSKSAFYSAFKKVKGASPADFLKRVND